MTIQEQLIAAGMSPNYIPPHKRTGFNINQFQGYVIPPKVMKDVDGNEIPGNPFYDEEMTFWQTIPSSVYCNNKLANCEGVETTTPQTTTTAGTGKIPTMGWYVVGAVALYFVGNKQKWF